MAENQGFKQVTLESVDRAITDWFDKTVDAHVTYPTGERKKLTVHYAVGERWAEARKAKAYRDKNGVIILPALTLSRKTIDRDPTMSALGTETGQLSISRQVAGKTNNLQNLYRNRDPQYRGPDEPIVYEVASIPFPDRVKLTYEIQIQASYITHMNAILEKVFNQLDNLNSFVAPLENLNDHPQLGEDYGDRKKIDRPYVVGFFEGLSDSGNLDEFTDQERIVRFTCTVTVPAVLNLDPEGERPALKVTRTSFKLGFGEEDFHFVDSQDEIDKIFGK